MYFANHIKDNYKLKKKQQKIHDNANFCNYKSLVFLSYLGGREIDSRINTVEKIRLS